MICRGIWTSITKGLVELRGRRKSAYLLPLLDAEGNADSEEAVPN